MNRENIRYPLNRRERASILSVTFRDVLSENMSFIFQTALASFSQYSFHPLFARTLLQANIESALGAFHQAPDNLRRSFLTYRWALSTSPEPMGSPFSFQLL